MHDHVSRSLSHIVATTPSMPVHVLLEQNIKRFRRENIKHEFGAASIIKLTPLSTFSNRSLSNSNKHFWLSTRRNQLRIVHHVICPQLLAHFHRIWAADDWHFKSAFLKELQAYWARTSTPPDNAHMARRGLGQWLVFLIEKQGPINRQSSISNCTSLLMSHILQVHRK